MDGHLGSIIAVQHRTELEKTNNSLIYSSLSRAGPKTREFKKQEINQMFAMDVIEPAQTKWASPIYLVQMKDRTLRLCAEFHKLNAKMTWD